MRILFETRGRFMLWKEDLIPMAGYLDLAGEHTNFQVP